jgi:subtilisin family serine protease
MASGQYILLPREGLRASEGAAANVLMSLPVVRSTDQPRSGTLEVADGKEVRVLDTLAENGPKLVELQTDAAEAINRPDSPVRAVPVVEYGRPNPPLRPLAGARDGGETMTVTCTDAATGAAVANVRVVAFTDFAQRYGGEGVTDASGTTTLHLSGPMIERLYTYAPSEYWGAFRQNLLLPGLTTLPLTPVELSITDCVRFYYGNSNFDASTGVTVGVADTGVGPHAALNLTGGRNTVTGEQPGDYADGGHHGTHVAGLVGANGSAPTGVRGLAPGISLRSYRVFPGGDRGATNYAILKALINAALDGCDIVNLSLGGGPANEIVEEAIRDARNQGMLVVMAAGNEGRRPVSYPAAYPGATAVSAMGREGTFPADSLDEGEIMRPPTSTDPEEFIAAFSNVGPEIAVTGPGVGALSTLPGDKFGALSGTSMASPVVAGAAACLLSRDTVTYGMPRDRARSDAIERLVQTSCVRRQFGAEYEGYGLPDPAMV